MSKEQTKPCCVCQKTLTSVFEDRFQVSDGGDVRMTFGYGSGKFDEFIGYTAFQGFICDECAAKMVPFMTKHGYDMHGLEILQPDPSNSRVT